MFVTAVALVVGALVESLLGSRLRELWLKRRGRALSGGSLFAFVAGGFLVGAYSHLFTDMLSAPDVAAPLEPFWPLLDKPWSLDLIWYSSFRWNVGLLAVGAALQLAAAWYNGRVRRVYYFSQET